MTWNGGVMIGPKQSLSVFKKEERLSGTLNIVLVLFQSQDKITLNSLV
jgi:hypothetical protein